jgi:MFS superfamily sulfate permease-like transporter
VLGAHGSVALIGLVSLGILFAVPRLPFGFAKKIPAPLVVLLFSIPAAWALGFENPAGDAHAAPMLVDLPASIVSAVTLPDFSAVLTPATFQYVALFAIIGTIESLLSAKAIDGLDPQRRRSDLDRDLLSVGIGNTVSSLIGGLPMISEIVRSSANVANGARTRAANFFHGMFLLAFVALLPFVVERIPLSALAAMLVFTGLRLASPHEFRRTFEVGWDQLTVFLVTLVGTVGVDLLVGVAAGIATQAGLELFRGAPLSGMFRPEVRVAEEEGHPVVHVGRAAVFSNYLAVRSAVVAACAAGNFVTIDLSQSRVVDHTVLEKLHEIEEEFAHRGGKLRIRGLDRHRSESDHPQACRYRPVA